jgi:hypothetical protein
MLSAYSTHGKRWGRAVQDQISPEERGELRREESREQRIEEERSRKADESREPRSLG